MVSDAIKDKYQRDIMGRKECSPIMPCGVCRAIHKGVPIYPLDHDYTKYTESVYI